MTIPSIRCRSCSSPPGTTTKKGHRLKPAFLIAKGRTSSRSSSYSSSPGLDQPTRRSSHRISPVLGQESAHEQCCLAQPAVHGFALKADVSRLYVGFSNRL